MKSEHLFASIEEIAAAYRSGAVSPLEITEAILDRIEKIDARLNAFITVCADEARLAAQRATEELRAGKDRGLLHGIPIALKDLVDTAGIRTTAGSRVWRQRIPDRDATIVEHLRQAGAVLVGKTNLLEFAYGIVHPDFGPTWNPWDLERTAGGSSGGSAAAVAAGLCYAAVGTDTGGSIRIPAAYCGIAGLKPTYAMVSLDGVCPLSWSLDHAGPLARSSSDAALLLSALRGERPQPLQPRPAVGLRLGILRQHLDGAEMDADVLEQFQQTCGALRAAGATLRDVEVADLDLGEETMMSIIAPEAAAIHTHNLARQADDFAKHTRAQLELGFAVPAVVYVRAQQFRRHLSLNLVEALSGVDALISPTAPWPAPHSDPVVVGEEGAAEARRTAPFNISGLPAHTVACGLTAAGLPVGFQIITRPGADRLALAIGAAVEDLRPQVLAALPHQLTLES